MKNISQEYYNLADSAASGVVEFIVEQESSDGFLKKAAEIYPGLVISDNARFLFYFDLVICYKKLGYEPDLSKKESLALFLAMHNSILGAKQSTYDILDAIIQVGAETFNRVVKSVILPQLDELPDDYGFLITTVLEALGDRSDAKKRYSILLYRLCSVIAKADGTITPSESEWLAALLNSSDGGSDVPPEFNPAIDNAENHLSEINSNIVAEHIVESSAIKELDDLVGLETVKKEVHTLANFALVQKRRGNKGLKATPLSMHFIFSGKPGTGKTTVARIMGRIYKDLGLLEQGHLIEADRSALVAEYIGQTAVKTNKVVDSAMGGVLFIDEAYSLVNGAKDDYGAEAISILLKRMEDSRDNLAVILAGYSDRMDRFISSNPGLDSRFSRKIEFEDYSAEELFSIYKLQLAKYDYMLTEEAAGKVRQVIRDAVADKSEGFGNGRYARNLFERTIECQANRVAYLPNADEKTLCTIELSDVKSL